MVKLKLTTNAEERFVRGGTFDTFHDDVRIAMEKGVLDCGDDARIQEGPDYYLVTKYIGEKDYTQNDGSVKSSKIFGTFKYDKMIWRLVREPRITSKAK